MLSHPASYGGRSARPIGFEELVSPLSRDEFFRRHWENAPFYGELVAGIADLVTLDEIETMLMTLSVVHPDWIQLVRNGIALSPESFRSEEGFVSLPAVYEALDAGHTLQLAKMQRRHPATARLCRDAESVFMDAGIALSRPIGSHLYLTPCGASGFWPHYDDHGVFVLQVSGAKRWKLYGSVEACPVQRRDVPIARADLPPLQTDLRLEAGQVLYIPRGCYHEAMAEEQISIHLTLDAYPSTWLDLISSLCRQSRLFREALPVGATLPTGSAGMERELAARCATLTDDGAVSRALSGFRRALLEALSPLPATGLKHITAADALTPSTIVCHRTGALPELGADGTVIQLSFAGSGVHAPVNHAAVLAFLVSTPRFVVSDIPGGLSDVDKLTLVRTLIAEGMLVTAPESGAAGARPAPP